MIAISYLKCEMCNGEGCYMEEITGNYEPYFQDWRDCACDKCHAKGRFIDLEDMFVKIDYKYGVHFTELHQIINATDMYLNGFNQRKEVILYSINALKMMGLTDELYKRYANRLDSVNRAIERVKNYKEILETHETTY
jgi:Fe-S-cluster formation regulator IscX/YfhJ